MSSPAWRTQKISQWNDLRREIDRESKIIRDKEIKVAGLKQALESLENSVLPILLYACLYKDDNSGRHDYHHFYYLPDLQMTKLDPNTRYIYSKTENFQRPNTLDLRKVFKNCGFPKEIVSTSPDFYTIRQKHQAKVDQAIKELEATIDYYFEAKDIESWYHLKNRLENYYCPQL